MSLRTPLAVSVVGALLLGGAVTGTTLALWLDESTMGQSQVDSGTIALHVNGTTSTTLGSLSDLALNTGTTPGAAKSVTATLTNASAGKNMRMRIHLDNVTTESSGLTSGLEVAASTVTTSGTCATPASSAYRQLSAFTSSSLTTTSLGPGAARKLCAFVRVKGGAGAGAHDQTGTLTFAFRGQQVRP